MNPVADEHLANFVVHSHINSHPLKRLSETKQEENKMVGSVSETALTVQLIPQDLLKKYIMYAKHKVHPKLNNIDKEKIERLYGELRKESMVRLSSRGCEITINPFSRAGEVSL